MIPQKPSIAVLETCAKNPNFNFLNKFDLFMLILNSIPDV